MLKVDTDALHDLAQRYQIQSIPNFAVFSGGRLSDSAPARSIIASSRSGPSRRNSPGSHRVSGCNRSPGRAVRFREP